MVEFQRFDVEAARRGFVRRSAVYLDYDWERIEALLRRIERLAVQLPTELQAFRSFLHQLNQE